MSDNAIANNQGTDGAGELQAPQIHRNRRSQAGLSNELKCYLLWNYPLLEKKDRLAKLLSGKRALFGIEQRQVCAPLFLFPCRCAELTIACLLSFQEDTRLYDQIQNYYGYLKRVEKIDPARVKRLQQVALEFRNNPADFDRTIICLS